MHTLLKSIYQNPIPIEKKNKLKDKINPTLSNKCRRHLKYMHISSFDWKFGGILSPIKFIDRDSVEYSLTAGSNGDINEMKIVANNSPLISSFITKKTSQFYKILR